MPRITSRVARRLLVPITLALVAMVVVVCKFSCGPTITPVAMPLASKPSARFEIVQPVGRLRTSPEKSVDFQFRLQLDGETRKPPVVIAQLLSGDVVVDSIFLNSQGDVSGRTVDYFGSIKMPSRTGTYRLRAQTAWLHPQGIEGNIGDLRTYLNSASIQIIVEPSR
jgi:hypothetical protein